MSDGVDRSVTAEGASRRTGRSRLWFAVAALVVGVAAAGGLLYAFMGEDSGAAGSSSPEDAVNQLVTALDNEDYVGALTYIPNDESGGIVTLVETLQSTASAQGVKGTISGEGLDLSVSVDELDTDQLSDRATAVDVTLAIGVTTDSTMTGALADAFHGGQSATVDLRVITVKLGGGWYVSPVMTAAEALVSHEDLPRGDFGRITAETPRNPAATAKDAVEGLAEAAVTFDVERTIDLVSPGEARALRVYQDAIEEWLARETYGTEFGNVSVDERSDGYLVDELTFSEYHDDGSSTQYRYNAGCLTRNEEDQGCLTPSRLGDALGISEQDLLIKAVEAEGGYRVSVIESIAALAGRAAANMNVHDTLGVIDLEALDTPQAIAVGDNVTGSTTKDLDYHVYQFTAEDGVKYAFEVTSENDNCWGYLYMPSGSVGWNYAYIEDVTAGPVRIIVMCDPASSFEFTLSTVQERTLDLPIDTTGELPPGGREIITFTATSDSYWRIDVSGVAGSVEPVAVGSDGEWESYMQPEADGRWFLPAHTYSITLRGTEEGGTYSLKVYEAEPEPEPFDMRGFTGGGYEITVSLDGSSVSVEYYAYANDNYTIVATPLAGQDITLYAPDCSDCYTVNWGGYGASESQSLRSKGDGYHSIIIDGYSSSDLYGLVTVTISYT